MIVLQYIYSRSERFQIFVANQLSVIHDGSMPQWRKVGTKESRADVSTGLNGFRMVSAIIGNEVLNSCGRRSLFGLPVVPEIASDDEELTNEVKCCFADVQHGNVRVRCSRPEVVEEHKSLSCWHRLKKGAAWPLRCKNRLRKKTGRAERLPSVSADTLVPSELQAAYMAIVRFVQRKHFKEELTTLESKEVVVKKSSIYLQELFLDEEGILRVSGRLRNPLLPEKALWVWTVSVPLW